MSSPSTASPSTISASKGLQGYLLIAVPHMLDERFKKAVILMCHHDSQSAMGFVINHQSKQLNLGSLYETLEIGTPRFCAEQPVFIGGPVDSNRGFVVHSQDHMLPESNPITHEIGLTTSLHILEDISNGTGPSRSIISLGYAGWGGGQLDAEIATNAWLTLPASHDLVFDCNSEDIWDETYAALGINPAHYTSTAGSA
ncbi:YqgE/AlgH family protein [Alphaproteobacteria bacterium]|nr:YqgE/AlgH family protein [Alphaproteobacteria bacterium]